MQHGEQYLCLVCGAKCQQTDVQANHMIFAASRHNGKVLHANTASSSPACKNKKDRSPSIQITRISRMVGGQIGRCVTVKKRISICTRVLLESRWLRERSSFKETEQQSMEYSLCAGGAHTSLQSETPFWYDSKCAMCLRRVMRGVQKSQSLFTTA